jgi:hypothetical protein
MFDQLAGEDCVAMLQGVHVDVINGANEQLFQSSINIVVFSPNA